MQGGDLPAYLTPNLNLRCTYRLQLSRDFPFQAAADCAEYFASLGVSHLYCSPILQAAPGSSHGYDVVDPTRINDELGGELGFHRMVSQLRGEGLDVMIDIVPNHMATVVPANRWWWDILKEGLSSRYAGFFDVNWDPPVPSLKGKVLLGVLSDRYGRELESGRLALERRDEEVVVRYHDDSSQSHRGALTESRLNLSSAIWTCSSPYLRRRSNGQAGR